MSVSHPGPGAVSTLIERRCYYTGQDTVNGESLFKEETRQAGVPLLIPSTSHWLDHSGPQRPLSAVIQWALYHF